MDTCPLRPAMSCVRERGKATGVTRELCTDADEHKIKEERDEHSALRTMPLAGPCPCSLRRVPASASGREELRR